MVEYDIKMTLICCNNCEYCEKDKSNDLDKSLYICLIRDKPIDNRFIDMCVKFKKSFNGY